MERMESALEASSTYSNSLQEQEQMLQEFEAGMHTSAARNQKKITLPVVVHVLYETEEQNISDDQILSQLFVLNRDFGFEQSDRFDIPSIWKNLGMESGFEFVLADVDPDGNYTTGITRTRVFDSEIGGGDDYYKSNRGGVAPWPQPHYINIWVCNIGDNILGYTFLPAATKPENDGIVMDPRAFGTHGLAQEPYNGGRTMVHEMGHYLGLRHLWGSEEGSCTNTDYMSDTPWQQEPNFGCPEFPTISCSSEPDGDMFMNFMDYVDDSCARFFTKRQVEFMQLVLRTSRVTLNHSNAVTSAENVSFPENLKVWPVPSSGTFFIAGTSSAPYQVFSTDGNLLAEGKVEVEATEIDLRDFSDGVYFIKSGSSVKSVVKITE